MSYIYSLLFSLFPGILLLRIFNEKSIISKATFTLFFSISFWIVLTYFFSLFHFPVWDLSIAILGLFIIIFLFNIKSYYPAISQIFRQSKFNIHYTALFIVILMYIAPAFFINNIPGCDSAMHGYIARLIINNNGLPLTYDPIIPNNNFGSYSAGIPIITAFFSGFNPINLYWAISFSHLLAYPLFLLSTIILIGQFTSEKSAIWASIIVLGVGTSLQNTVSWGGNPTIASLSILIYAISFFLISIKQNKWEYALISGFFLATGSLIHLIPFAIILYLSILTMSNL